MRHARLKIRKPHGMNDTEEAFSMRLEALRKNGQIEWWAFEPFKLRLAVSTFYSPDFGVLRRDQTLELIEVKGFWRDDARVKIKCAAEKFPMFRFTAATKKPKKEGGGWAFEVFS